MKKIALLFSLFYFGNYMHPMGLPAIAPAGIAPVPAGAFIAPPIGPMRAPAVVVPPLNPLPNPNITHKFLEEITKMKGSYFTRPWSSQSYTSLMNEQDQVHIFPSTTFPTDITRLIQHYVMAEYYGVRSAHGERPNPIGEVLKPENGGGHHANLVDLRHQRPFATAEKPYGQALLHLLAQDDNSAGIETAVKMPLSHRLGTGALHAVNINQQRSFDRFTPLHVATINNNERAVRTLLTLGANPNINTQEGTPLCLAAKFGYTNIVKLLLEHKADRTLKDAYNRTPLILAVYHHDDVELFNLLKNSNAMVPDFDDNQHFTFNRPLYPGQIGGQFQEFTLLSLAAFRGHSHVLSKIIKTPHIIINRQHSKGNTACHYAACVGNNHCLRLLIQAGADPFIKNEKGVSAFLSTFLGMIDSAVFTSRHSACLETFLTLPQCDINEQNKKGHTALDFALLGKHQQAVSRLLEHPHVQLSHHTLMNARTKETLHMLLDKLSAKGQEVTPLDLFLVFMNAMEKCDRAFATYCCSLTPTINSAFSSREKTSFALQFAVEEDKIFAIPLIINKEVLSSEHKQAAWKAALVKDNGHILKTFDGKLNPSELDAPSITEKSDFHWLTLAVKHNCINLLKAFVRQLKNNEERLQEIACKQAITRAIIEAINKGHEECVEALIPLQTSNYLFDADEDIRRFSKSSILIHAFNAQNKIPRILPLLVQRNPEAIREQLLIETKKGDSDAVSLLLRSSEPVFMSDSDGNNALIIAAQNNDSTIAQLLCESGIETNHKNKIGKTALFYAIEHENFRLVELLLAHDARTHIELQDGSCPLSIAALKGNAPLIRLLAPSLLKEGGKQALSFCVQGKSRAYVTVDDSHVHVTSINNSSQVTVQLTNEPSGISLIGQCVQAHNCAGMQMALAIGASKHDLIDGVSLLSYAYSQTFDDIVQHIIMRANEFTQGHANRICTINEFQELFKRALVAQNYAFIHTIISFIDEDEETLFDNEDEILEGKSIYQRVRESNDDALIEYMIASCTDDGFYAQMKEHAHEAIQQFDKKMIALFIKEGLPYEKFDPFKVVSGTALEDNSELLTMLVKHFPNTHIRYANNPSFLRKLLQVGANPNAFNEDDDTPLKIAIKGKSIEAIKMLLEAGAQVNEKQNYYVDYALETGSFSALVLLVQAGVSLEGRNLQTITEQLSLPDELKLILINENNLQAYTLKLTLLQKKLAQIQSLLVDDITMEESVPRAQAGNSEQQYDKKRNFNATHDDFETVKQGDQSRAKTDSKVSDALSE